MTLYISYLLGVAFGSESHSRQDILIGIFTLRTHNLTFIGVLYKIIRKGPCVAEVCADKLGIAVFLQTDNTCYFQSNRIFQKIFYFRI